jgi:hypothetical protein
MRRGAKKGANLVVVAACFAFFMELATGFSVLQGQGLWRNAGRYSRHCTRASQAVSTLMLDPVGFIQASTFRALDGAGDETGLEALSELGRLCTTRQPYKFDSKRVAKPESLISFFPKLFPRKTTVVFLEQVGNMEEKGWMSTNPDSVDGLPSFHLNLISQGRPLVAEGKGDLCDFERGLLNLLSIVRSPIYGTLLPRVQSLLNTTDIIISDVFLRRYGQNIANSTTTRRGISAHYDVLSVATAVVAMDDVAKDGENGLYTLAMSPSGATSNHASLRRFFPLERGDGVIHTWDILHGVDVQNGLGRTSLIVWFSTKAAMVDSERCTNYPWLMGRPDRGFDDVVQFVLGSALESSQSSAKVDGIESVDSITSTKIDESANNRAESEKDPMNPIDLYLQSALRGNPFALTRLGSLCADEILSPQQLQTAITIVETQFADPPRTVVPLLARFQDNPFMFLACRFWLEASVKGNPVAQRALADITMHQAVETGSTSMRVLAATLFALAAQQGVAQDSLERVVAHEAHLSGNEDAFLASPVVEVASVAMAYCDTG